MLGVFDLGNNNLTGNFPYWLGSMSNLRVLVLRSNRFHGHLGNGTGLEFPRLQLVDISANQFTGSLSSKYFSGWRGMMLDEAQSNFKRKILGFNVLQLIGLYYQDTVTVTNKGLQMELVKILTAFTCIDFSNNEFEGEIPEVIGNLSSLYVLNFSRNAFKGTIPSTIGNLVQLESLDLSQNKLSGEIPLELSRLSFLSVMNLSFNKLEGKIPSGSQFQTFQESSFEGNDGLCGVPLPKLCNNINDEFDLPQEGLDSEKEFDWVLLAVSFLGFMVGASMIIGPQYFSKKGREWANELDKLSYAKM